MRAPGCDSTGAEARGASSRPRSGAAARKRYHTPEVRGGGREDLPHPGGQGPHPRGATPPPRRGCFAGAGGPRGATPCSRSGGAAVRNLSL